MVGITPEAQKGLDYLKTANPALAAGVTNAFAAPTTINASDLSNPMKMNVPTYTPPIASNVAPPPPAIDFGIEAKKAAADQSQSDLKAALDQQGNQAVVKSNLETAQGIPQINSQLQELYAQDAKYQADLTNIASQQLQANNTSQDRLAPTFAINGEQAQIARQAQNAQQNINIQRATNAAAITAAQGRLALAQQYVQDALDREFTPLASKIDYLKTVLATNQDNLSKAEQAQLQQQIDQRTQEYQQGQDNKKNVYQLLLTAAQNGADNATLQDIQRASSPDEALVAAGPFLTSAQTQLVNAGGQVKLINTATGKTIANLGATDTALSLSQGGGGGGIGTGGDQFASTVDIVSNTGTSVYQQKAIAEQMQQALSAGDYQSAYQMVLNATANGLDGTNRSTFNAASIDLGVLADLQSAIQAYTDAGGDMNILKGKVDEIGTKIGQLETDPDYAALAVRLDRAFQQYRLNMTGAAFGDAESAEYGSVLPSKNNSLDLNLAKIDGALASTKSYINSAVKAKIGTGGVNIGELAFPETKPTPTDATARLDSTLAKAATDVPDVQEEPKSWFDKFMNIFGL